MGLVVDLVFFDFVKAFDTVNHSVLLDKLACIGVNQQLIRWIECFLTRRTMQVSVSGALSDPVSVTSGVPQGSVLGPVLFLIYVNHTVSQLKSKYMIFADDIKLYLAHPDGGHGQSSHNQLQHDVNTLVETSRSWGLDMNASKCSCLRFAPGSSAAPSSGPSALGPGWCP